MKKVIPILLVALVLLCGIGSYALRTFKKPGAADEGKYETVTRGDVVDTVIETGTISPIKTVEVKSRVSGRIAHLYVDEGDFVKQGQLVATIDPLEINLIVSQDRAQVSGAKSAVEKANLEIEQRKISARAALEQAKQHLIQVEAENHIQPTLTQSSIDEAEASWNQARQDRDRLATSVQPAQRASTKASLDEAKANVAQAQSEYVRQQELLAKGYTSRRDVETARQQLDVAQARLNAADEASRTLETQLALDLEKANEQVRQTQAQLASAKANQIQVATKQQDYLSAVQDVEKARAALDDVPIMMKARDQSEAQVDQLSSLLGDAERQLRETQIRAPISGIVSKKLMQEGELVASLSSFSAGSPIFDIEDRSQMRVLTDVNEIDAAKMKVGMTPTITVDALPSLKMQGVIRRIAPASTDTTASTSTPSSDTVVKYQVEILIKNAPSDLRTGMSAKCTLEVLHRSNVLTLPLEFVGLDGNQHYVMLAPASEKDAKAKPTRADIGVGVQNGSKVEILSGVTEGAKVERPEYKGPPRKGMMQAGPD